MYVRPSQVTTSVIMRVLAQALPGRASAGQRSGSLERRPPSAIRPLVFAI